MRDPVDQDLEMKVVAFSKPGAADQSDLLPLGHHLPRSDEQLVEVRISGEDPIALIDDDEVAVAAVPASREHHTIGDRDGWRIGSLRAEILTLVIPAMRCTATAESALDGAGALEGKHP